MRAATLKGIYLFAELDSSELSRLEAICTLSTVPAGDDVFSHGDRADAIYVINYGTVRIHRGSRDIDEIPVTTLGSGAHFGELPWISQGQRSATATALEKTELTRIEYGALSRLLAEQPGMGLKVYRTIARQMAFALLTTTDDLIFARNVHARHH
jgi:CRP-like cAMP-binding protein